MDAIRRSGGPANYNNATQGQLGGVDLQMSTMNYFMGEVVLTELLFLGKVGIFVDSPGNDILRDLSLAETKNLHPYLYIYQAEDIVNWQWFLKDNELELKFLRLRLRRDDEFYVEGSLADRISEYRDFFVDDQGLVFTRQLDPELNPITEPVQLDVKRIPFVLLEMKSPLLKDVARYQVALLNLESSDLSFLHNVNFNTFIKFYDPYSEFANQLQANNITEPLPPLPADNVTPSTETDETRSGRNPAKVHIGQRDGLRIPNDTNPPMFLGPSDIQIKVSMEKQDRMKDDIKRLINLAAAAAHARYTKRGGATAGGTETDEAGLNSGLSAVGAMLETAERRVGRLWREYEAGPPITVHYPQRYSLRTDDERRKDAESLIAASNLVPSALFRQEMQSEAALIWLGGKLGDEKLDTMLAEIRKSPFPTADPKQIRDDAELGLVSRAGASKARGYPENEAEEAEAERVVRDKSKLMAQGASPESNLSARGGDEDREGAIQEKKESQAPENNDGKKAVRGEGK
jgi:hypothetical protein